MSKKESKKDNLNQAMYEMFGVGKAPEAEPAEEVKPVETSPSSFAVEAPDTTYTGELVAVPVTYLAPGIVLEGKLTAKGDVEIAGELKGDVTTTGRVVVRSHVHGNVTAGSLHVCEAGITGDVNVNDVVILGSDTVVNGNVSAGDLLCSGTIKGDVSVKNNFALDTNAVVEGNITTATMTMAQGAVIGGTVTMKGKK
jgi:cytoskeletal protein CcmA (bactofilin family)